jgi:DNA-binding NarL/FixJ family response regulator
MRRLRRSDYDALGPGKIFPSPDLSRGRLTGGEQTVAHLIADGLERAEIADRVGLSPDTAGAYIDAVKRRLGLATRAEVTAWVLARRMPRRLRGHLWRIGDTQVD